MDASFEPVSSSNPPRENLAKRWQAVSKSIRDSFDHKAIPEDLKAAMKGRARLYLSAVGEASDVMDLAAGGGRWRSGPGVTGLRGSRGRGVGRRLTAG